MRRLIASLVVLLSGLIGCGPVVRADVGVVLNESLDTSVARITGSGHSAIYFSRICPETPVKLRLCSPGEHGSIISNYTTLGENYPYQWNITSLSMYLYGVDNPGQRPLFGSRKIKDLLEDRYRQNILSGYCAGPCATSKKAEWREMVGASTSRSIYIFVVSTTVQQDLDLIAKFNAQPNRNHFNPITRNCANFARTVVNTYFPGATRGDYLNDFGMTSPKAIARSFVRYAHRHPQAEYHVFHFGQIPGTIKRSTVTRDGTEQLYHSKKLLVPMLIFASHELPFIAASYIITGRFDPEHEYETHSSVAASDLHDEMSLVKYDGDYATLAVLQDAAMNEQRQNAGTPAEWNAYRSQFEQIRQDAIRAEIITPHDSASNFFKALDESGVPLLDRDGLWLQMDKRDRSRKVGLSPSNLLSPESDPRLAFNLIFAHVQSVLNSPPHGRENIAEFRGNWSLLLRARDQLQLSASVRP